ncbi:hypothetical protein GC194_07100 [bacterium]|nr:hypothetical protein [bacterium]
MSTEIHLPNFVVAGAAKSGSTSLYEYIKGHPQIFLPEKKESRFFASEKLVNTLGYNKTSVFQWADFVAQYSKATEQHKAIGDFGNLYMIFPELAIANIKKYLGSQVKVVFIIRNPVKRAYSAYQMARRNFYEDQSFEQGLALETQRLEEAYVPCDIIAYKKMGLYYAPIKQFMEHFKVHVMVLEELNAHPRKELRKLFDFLELTEHYAINIEAAHNRGGTVPATKVNIFRFQKFLKKLKPYLGFIPGLSTLSEKTVKSLAGNLAQKTNTAAEPLSPELEARLKEEFRSNVQNLSELLQKDLGSLWNMKINAE